MRYKKTLLASGAFIAASVASAVAMPYLIEHRQRELEAGRILNRNADLVVKGIDGVRRGPVQKPVFIEAHYFDFMG